MCGIAGAVGFVDDRVQAGVRRAHEALRHRGPDAEGSWAPPGGAGGVILAHRRLAIIDLSADGTQPMVDADTGAAVVFNGEIYNFRELRRELEGGGARFRTRTDTEVILKGYAAWGEECVRRLRGMFAFALWDPARRRLLLARDRLGLKPLYYAAAAGREGAPALLFASEVRALLATGLVARRLDPVGLATYLWNGFACGPATMVAGVRLLPAGTTLTVGAGGRAGEPRRFWRLPPARPAPGATEELEARLAEAVRLRLIADVPLGVFLSGGIDSTAVAALAARAAGGSVRTFNIGFAEEEYDESRHAREAARAIGTEHVEIRLGEADFQAGMGAALASLDQPTFDGLNTFFISKAVRAAGITVALAGTGGDELFGGYRSFRDLPRARAWGRRLGWLPGPWLAALGRLATRARLGRPGEVAPQTRWGKAADVLLARGDLLALYQLSYALFTPAFQARLGGRPPGAAPWGLPPERAAELRDLIANESILSGIAALEASCFLGERLLRDTDAASMAVALEVRLPLIDHEVVEALAGVDEARRFRPLGRKELLRRLGLRGVPPALFDRPKAGFVLPIEVWCRRLLRDEVAATLQDAGSCRRAGLEPAAVAALWRSFTAGAPGLYWSRIWALFVLLRWCGAHEVGG